MTSQRPIIAVLGGTGNEGPGLRPKVHQGNKGKYQHHPENQQRSLEQRFAGPYVPDLNATLPAINVARPRGRG